MSSETLERILNVTLSESMLDGVLPIAPTLQSAHLPPPTFQSVHLPPASSCTTSATTSDCSTAFSVEPNLKRPKPDQSQAELFPSEHDIDNFLDQIHQ